MPEQIGRVTNGTPSKDNDKAKASRKAALTKAKKEHEKLEGQLAKTKAALRKVNGSKKGAGKPGEIGDSAMRAGAATAGVLGANMAANMIEKATGQMPPMAVGAGMLGLAVAAEHFGRPMAQGQASQAALSAAVGVLGARGVLSVMPEGVAEMMRGPMTDGPDEYDDPDLDDEEDLDDAAEVARETAARTQQMLGNAPAVPQMRGPANTMVSVDERARKSVAPATL